MSNRVVVSNNPKRVDKQIINFQDQELCRSIPEASCLKFDELGIFAKGLKSLPQLMD